MKGLIALDIDGTVVTADRELSPQVISYLTNLSKNKQCQIAFISGRTFEWSLAALKQFKETYYLATQNGSAVFKMPQKTLINKNYLNKEDLQRIIELCSHIPCEIILCSGFENDDILYYCKKSATTFLKRYIQERQKLAHEKWAEINTWNDLNFSEFPSIKLFCHQFADGNRLAKEIHEKLGFEASQIFDPLNHRYFFIQVTKQCINKGEALKLIIKALDHPTEWTIVAGDDKNDEPMLKEATIAVVMETAPEDLLKKADVIASSPTVDGIIDGIKKAIKLVNESLLKNEVCQ